MSNAYKTVNKSALKLKGVSSGKVDKKKSQSVNSESAGPSRSTEEIRVTKTPAEIAFEEAKKRHNQKWVKDMSQKSHKERIVEFNQKLESLTEHFDVPKVSWTK